MNSRLWARSADRSGSSRVHRLQEGRDEEASEDLGM
jgi:hypothetical protein